MPDDEERGWGFHLPPLRIPSVDLGDIEMSLPVPERVAGEPLGPRGVLALAVVVDLLDAGLLLTLGDRGLIVRSLVVLGVSLAMFGWLGLSLAWEPVVAWLGVAVPTLVPSLTLLVTLRALGSRVRGSNGPNRQESAT
ncbi:MAG: hypothetical protein ABEJ55_00160 [Halanaeroarchaeum sp.]